MLFNSFFGLKLKKLIAQLAIFFIVIIVFFLLIQTKNDKKHEKIRNSEIIYEKNEFNDELVKKRVKQSAPWLKIKVKSVDLSSFVDFIEENTFEFDQWKLSDGILKKFYKNGNLHDCEVLEVDMLDFLKENQNDIDILVKRFLNKFQSIE